MKALAREVDSNFSKFNLKWWSELAYTHTALIGKEDVFKRAYRKLTSLQAWRATLLEEKLDKDALAFFLEAQNDALVSAKPKKHA